jgi:ubiquinone biosynthesis protein
LDPSPRELDTDELQSEISDFLSEYANQSLDSLDVGGALDRMMEIIRRFRIILPARVSLLIKVLIMLEGTARKLSPAFSLAEILAPYQSKIMQRRLSPAYVFSKARRNVADWTRLVEMAPRELADILTQIKRGKFDVHLEHRKLDPVINRLVLCVLTAALFVGSSMILSSSVPPTLFDVSIVGALGCFCSFVMGFRLIYSIRVSGNIDSKS